VFVYWELVMVGPIVGSYSFDLFGTTPRGYGASTIGYAFLGALVLLGVGSLLDSTLDSPSGRHDRGAVSLIRSYRDRDSTRGRAFVCVSLLIAVLLVTIDFVEGSPAMAVHQAGVGFGALAGATVSLIRTESVDVLTRNTRRWREGSATSDSAPFDDGSD
jgi:hypothetical protein